jgi:hypothetical protein
MGQPDLYPFVLSPLASLPRASDPHPHYVTMPVQKHSIAPPVPQAKAALP